MNYIKKDNLYELYKKDNLYELYKKIIYINYKNNKYYFYESYKIIKIIYI